VTLVGNSWATGPIEVLDAWQGDLKLQVDPWGGQDSNLRPTDYEFDPALSRTREIESRGPLTSGFSPQRSPTLRNISQSVAGPMRDTSRAAHTERRERELLCIRTNERVRLIRAESEPALDDCEGRASSSWGPIPEIRATVPVTCRTARHDGEGGATDHP
jgi:hypothetical protein